MTKIDLLTELAHAIDKDINVYYGDMNECQIKHKNIYYSEVEDIEDILVTYLTIDLGYNYLPYCSTKLYWFIHELGHIVNGWIDRDGYTLVREVLLDSNNLYDSLYQYVRLDDEVYANEWAMDFIKKNKGYIKRLDKELRMNEGI